ncbi:diguanylate cyclase domain-containing protein [Paraurantiacibacter namhicola]|uniref:Putative diguanylate cyclase YeaP n=1 Tax=Paraurantiacibacter namhicola TaxID=645517 RepID=A0A1C7D863_9SPHN|nr:diguanylate cyclase [Paraurantiacibacter namhicola]ANU07552.1 putative diguanylate cyclase YeaP [Paraurantiacibacter namhicola]
MSLTAAPGAGAVGCAVSRIAHAIARIREWHRPILAALVLCVIVIAVRPAEQVDSRFSDQLLASQAVQPDADLAIVEITAEDTRRFGGQPVPRAAMAALVNGLADAGVDRAYLDFNLGEAISAGPDEALANALARFDKDRIALASGVTPEHLPAPVFQKHATVLDSRIAQAPDGWYRAVGQSGGARGANPSAWLANGSTTPQAAGLDLRVAHWQFPRASMSDVIDGKADLKGKTVVVTFSRSFAPTRTFLPIAGESDRAAVFLLGAQSQRNGYDTVLQRGERANIALQLFAILIGFVTGLVASSGRKLLLLMGAIMFFVLATNASIAASIGAPAQPSTALFCFLVMVNVTLVQRLRIVPMIANFLKGDLSPDEALAWRALEPQERPAMLFGANGQIKRMNAAARDRTDLPHGEIAQACFPRMGERGQSIALQLADGSPASFALDWPYPNVPVVVLEDRTATDAMTRQLQRQLEVDEMTGCLNRRGFDNALSAARNTGRNYAVFFIDMNGFKAINDTYGHDAGDELLVATAARLQALSRSDDHCARLGGDEFAMIVMGTVDADTAQRLRSRIEQEIAVPVKLRASAATVMPSAAVGFAMSSFAGEDPAAVLRRADQDMYQQKGQGRAAPRAA